MVLTARGREVLVDPVAAWHEAVTSVIDGDDFDAAVIRFALTALLDEVEEREDLEEVVAVLCTEQGWAHGPDQVPVSSGDVRWGLGELWRRCAIHGFMPHGMGGNALTDVGVTAARAALRMQATGPRQSPMGV